MNSGLVEKIISGGQTGADQAALYTARMLNIPTGGMAPKGWITEDGPEPALESYGLIQSDFNDYKPRTIQNVQDSDGTVIFGDIQSSGSKLTMWTCIDNNKPYWVNPDGAMLREFVRYYKIKVLNVAGNRASKNPEVFKVVEKALTEAFGGEMEREIAND